MSVTPQYRQFRDMAELAHAIAEAGEEYIREKARQDIGRDVPAAEQAYNRGVYFGLRKAAELVSAVRFK